MNILSINYIFWLILSGVFFAGGEFLSKKFALNPSIVLVICILLVYSVGILFWLPAILQKNQLSVVGTLWSVISLAITILMGVLVFGEKVSLTGVIGIVFAFMAIILLSI